jgi:hypothetical protein
MRRCLAVLATATVATFIGAPAALACGGLVAPNGAVKLVNTTTLVAYHDGVEHYVTSFEYAGGGTKFGSIIPLPGVPTSVTRGGSWTLQRLELEVHPPAPQAFNGAVSAASAAGSAQVLLRTHVDALTITVVKGGGPAVTAWVRQQGFKVSPDLPAMLNFYAVRSPIFLTATFDPAAEAARGLHLGDGTPVDIAIPLSNPWVPLHILSLAKDPDDIVRADVFMLTDRQPALLSGPGVQLRVSRPAEPALLNDLRSDRGMAWIPASAWLSYITVHAPASSLTYDLAADVSGNGHPSLTAAALVPAVTLRAPASSQSGWRPTAVLAGIGFLVLLLATIGYLDRRRRA